MNIDVRAGVLARFWAKVNTAGPLHPILGTPCWLWTGRRQRNGYGQAGMRKHHFGTRLAHRVSYMIARGSIPEGLELDHLCREHACVNPAHLEPVTTKENSRRGLGGVNHRVLTHCPQGHPYAGENLIERRGHRACRTCSRVSWREYKARKRAAMRAAG